MLWREQEHEPLTNREWDPARVRYTLFTGDIGVALYLRACLEASPEFPILDAF